MVFWWGPSGFLGFSKTVSMVFHRFPSWSVQPCGGRPKKPLWFKRDLPVNPQIG